MTRKIVVSTKDDNGLYQKGSETIIPPSEVPLTDTSLDDILKRQLNALDRVTRQLSTRASQGDMTKAEIDALATCIKVTMDLKANEVELLDSLSDEDLEKLASQS